MTDTAVLAEAHAPERRPRTYGHGRPAWSSLVLIVAVVVATPVLAVVADGLGSLGDTAPPRDLGRMVLTTLTLMLGVGAGSLVIGGGLAWLVTAYRFPGRGAMSWLLVQNLGASGFELGLLQVFQFGTVLFLSIPAGIVADRFPKRRTLLMTQSLIGTAA